MDNRKKSLPPRYEIILILCRGERPFSIYLYTKGDPAASFIEFKCLFIFTIIPVLFFLSRRSSVGSSKT